MNYQMLSPLNDFYDVCDMIEKSVGGLVPAFKKMSMKEMTKYTLLLFVIFLSMSDDVVTKEEADFINFYFNQNVTPEQVSYLFSCHCGEDYSKSVPDVLQVFVTTDIIIRNYFKKTITPVSIAFALLLNDLGKELLSCDNNVTEKEVETFTNYMNMIYDYINVKLLPEIGISEKLSFTTSIEITNKTDVLSSDTENKSNLDNLLIQLNSLVGLKNVKNDVQSLINLLQIRKIRESKGLKIFPLSLHLVFSGNAGTGKTTVARLIAKIYHELGFLSKGQLVEVDRAGLVGGYVGQTAIKVQEVINKAKGGVLFIDEAYSLTANKGENDFGLEAVDTLIKGMEDNRNDLVVIVAGYPELMENFLRSNPGLKSRFNKFIMFEDYNGDELLEIFKKFCTDSGYKISDDCLRYLRRYFSDVSTYKEADFSNARFVRNLFEKAITKQANRLVSISNVSDEDLSTITYDDVI